MTFDGWVDHLMREMLDAFTDDDWYRVRTVPVQESPCSASTTGWSSVDLQGIC
jgi:hypothetical protein